MRRGERVSFLITQSMVKTRRAARRQPVPTSTAHRVTPARSPSRLRRRRALVLAALMVAAVVVRVTYFRELAPTLFAQLQEWRQSDMHYYDGWARSIAGGDWRSASVDVPMHRWHHDVATAYFATHPDERHTLETTAAQRGSGLDADTLLWRRWMRVPQFYQDPLYAYIVAGVYRVAGPNVLPVFVLQLTAGLVTVLLIWYLAVRFFDDEVALVAGAMAVLCGPLLSYEMLLLRDSLIACAGLVVVAIAERAMVRPTWRWFGLLGIVIGVSILLKSTFVLLAVVLIVAIAVRFRSAGRSWLTPAAAVAGGLVLALLPLAARNLAVGVSPWALASSGALTFASTNEPQYLPEVGFGVNVPVLAEILGDSDGRSVPAVTATWRRQDPASYLLLLWQKWTRLWHWYEIPNNENFYYLRRQAAVLEWLPITFWLIGPLGLVGLFLAAPRHRQAWPLYALVAVHVVTMLMFYVLARFRLALTAAVIPFAACAVVEAWRSLRGAQVVRALVIAGSIVLAAAWTGRPLGAHQVLIRMSDWILPYSVFYQRRVYDALDAKDLKTAGAWYLEFFARYEPSDATIVASDDTTLGPELADMHQECANILAASGQTTLAEAQRVRATQILQLPRLR